MTPSYHYPLGGTLSLPRRRALLARAHATGAWMLKDDYYGEYRFAGRPSMSRVFREWFIIAWTPFARSGFWPMPRRVGASGDV